MSLGGSHSTLCKSISCLSQCSSWCKDWVMAFLDPHLLLFTLLFAKLSKLAYRGHCFLKTFHVSL